MNRLLKYLIITVVVIIIYFAVSYLRTAPQMDEQIPNSFRLDQMATESTDTSIQKDLSDKRITTDADTAEQEKSAVDSFDTDMTDKPPQEPQTEESEPTAFVVKSASLSGRGPYDNSGLVQIIDDGKQNYILRFTGFSTTPGPDLRVWLATDDKGANKIDLGPLKANQGNFFYPLPDDFDPNAFSHVMIRCRAFFSTFGVGVFN